MKWPTGYGRSSENRQRTSKGQYLIIEEMVIFLIGMLIVLGSMVTFQTFGDDLETKTSQQEMNLVGERIASLAVQLADSGSEASARFEIPRKITGKSYVISLLQGEGISIRLAKGAGETTVPLRGLENSLDLEGKIGSTIENPKLTYRENGTERLTLGW